MAPNRRIEILVPYAELALGQERLGDSQTRLILGLAHELRHFHSWARINRQLLRHEVDPERAWNYLVNISPMQLVLEIQRFEDKARSTERRIAESSAAADIKKFICPEMEVLQRLMITMTSTIH